MRAPLASTLASTLVWAAWAFILFLVIAAFAAMLFALLTVPVPSPACTSVDAEALPETTVEALLAEGFYADPADGAERLYSKGCRVPAE